MRLLIGCSYSPCESFATTRMFRNGWRKMLLRIYGRVLESQNRHFVVGIIPPPCVTHRWKGLFELVPKRPRWRRYDEKWPSGRSSCFYFSPVPYYQRHNRPTRPALSSRWMHIHVHSSHGAAFLAFRRHWTCVITVDRSAGCRRSSHIIL